MEITVTINDYAECDIYDSGFSCILATAINRQIRPKYCRVYQDIVVIDGNAYHFDNTKVMILYDHFKKSTNKKVIELIPQGINNVRD